MKIFWRKVKCVSAKVRISLRLELYRFIVHSFLAKYSTEITTFLSKAEKKWTRLLSSKNYKLNVSHFWARTQEKLGVYFCEVCLFSDSAKTKHIYGVPFPPKFNVTFYIVRCIIYPTFCVFHLSLHSRFNFFASNIQLWFMQHSSFRFRHSTFHK